MKTNKKSPPILLRSMIGASGAMKLHLARKISQNPPDVSTFRRFSIEQIQIMQRGLYELENDGNAH